MRSALAYLLTALCLFCQQLNAAEEELTATVDWMQEVVNGGVTSLALGLLCLGSVALLIERALQLKLDRFAPDGLADKALSLWRPGGIPAILKLCQGSEAVLARVIYYAAKHHKADPDLIFSGASDIIHRAMRKENHKNTLLAVSAALAPLLGLLGTMIGMIESFKLVELYGDEGGASMLAGSISKALITTAVGLIIAILSLIAYHYYRMRISSLTLELEEKVEDLLNTWFLPTSSHAKAQSAAPNSSDGETPKEGLSAKQNKGAAASPERSPRAKTNSAKLNKA